MLSAQNDAERTATEEASVAARAVPRGGSSPRAPWVSRKKSSPPGEYCVPLPERNGPVPVSRHTLSEGRAIGEAGGILRMLNRFPE